MQLYDTNIIVIHFVTNNEYELININQHTVLVNIITHCKYNI